MDVPSPKSLKLDELDLTAIEANLTKVELFASLDCDLPAQQILKNVRNKSWCFVLDAIRTLPSITQHNLISLALEKQKVRQMLKRANAASRQREYRKHRRIAGK